MTSLDREIVLGAFDAALAAVEPVRATVKAIDEIDSGGRFPIASIGAVVAIGKASVGMATGARQWLPDVPTLVVSSHADVTGLPVVVGDHPVPGPNSFAAGAAVTDFVTGMSDRPIMFLVSGGGSALCEAPAAGVSSDDIVNMNTALLTSGLAIAEMNSIRAVASRLKAGGLTERINTPCLTLVISDVPGGDPNEVASGPSIPSTLGSGAAEAIAAHGLGHELPASVAKAAVGWTPHQDRPDDVVEVIGSPGLAASAASRYLAERGVPSRVGTIIDGPVDVEVAETLAEAQHGVVVRSGEPTVAVHGDGVGGRNQHAALLAALAMDGDGGVFAALGTDGRDGATDAAGAIVDGGTAQRIRRRGLSPEVLAERFDAHPGLGAAGDLIVTGPTGTNVADLWIASV